jgi:hypothetical protein
MSFTTALDSARALAAEYTVVDWTISTLAVGADHDPNWGPADEAELAAKETRRREITRLLAAAFVELARDHRDDWQAFLVASTERLSALAKHGDKRIHADYERDRFMDWTRGSLAVADQPEIFARGTSKLQEHRTLIDNLVRKA